MRRHPDLEVVSWFNLWWISLHAALSPFQWNLAICPNLWYFSSCSKISLAPFLLHRYLQFT